jgi:hypothetical protein
MSAGLMYSTLRLLFIRLLYSNQYWPHTANQGREFPLSHYHIIHSCLVPIILRRPSASCGQKNFCRESLEVAGNEKISMTVGQKTVSRTKENP